MSATRMVEIRAIRLWAAAAGATMLARASEEVDPERKRDMETLGGFLLSAKDASDKEIGAMLDYSEHVAELVERERTRRATAS